MISSVVFVPNWDTEEMITRRGKCVKVAGLLCVQLLQRGMSGLR